MRRRFFFLIPIFLIFSGFSAFSEQTESLPADWHEKERFFPPRQPPARDIMNFNGRKMQKREGKLSVIGVKVFDMGELLSLSVFFNAPLDSNSIQSQGFLIDERPLPPDTEFLFNKPRNMIRFEVKKSFWEYAKGLPVPDLPESQQKSFSLKILFARSFDGKIMQPVEIQNLEANSFYKYHRGEQKWQKSAKNPEF